jgi:hypothetical protein
VPDQSYPHKCTTNQQLLVMGFLALIELCNASTSLSLSGNLKGPQEFQKAEDVTPRYTPMHQYKTGISDRSSLQTNFSSLTRFRLILFSKRVITGKMITVSLPLKQTFKYQGANT